MSPQTQDVTEADIKHYLTSPDGCRCPDYLHRGSYSTATKKQCKHMVKLVSYMHFYGTQFDAKHGVWVCGCDGFIDSCSYAHEIWQGDCWHTQAANQAEQVAV